MASVKKNDNIFRILRQNCSMHRGLNATIDDTRVDFSSFAKEDSIPPSKENEERGDRDGTPVLPRIKSMSRAHPRAR